MDKILITGGSGLLGSNIAKLAGSQFEVYATYFHNKVFLKDVNFLGIDLTDKEALKQVREIKPNFIIHSAAATNIDYCEENPQEAHRHNVLASRYMAEMAKEIGAYFIYISTDCVFDGKKGNYTEEDKVGPINIYGETKLEGERQVLDLYSSSCIVRTNIYGWNKLNKFSLAEWMIAKLSQGNELPGFRDVLFSPILVNDLTKILFKLYEKKYPGILHVGAKELCSKLDFAYKIAEVFSFDKNYIKSVDYKDIGLKAPRGQNMSFNISKAQEVLSEELPDIRSGLKKMKQLQEEKYVDELKNG
ncbi:dTDP-4-dehydrorhamnose reductase [hydrothermal vent metagenome]|uniref:dTDP-4-dehydrorhamnose reductase n=1 Tax=hydrothermal vent metagenome TaxID=652676 RepID=A0A3B0WHB8_9ZZZZ